MLSGVGWQGDLSIEAGTLNREQLKAVEHPDGPLLVLAGPGTGKTKVLVSRIAYLVGERGVSPKRILALTFSRRAADEMRERVKEYLPEAGFADCRTFHSFALALVRKNAAALGLPAPPELISTGEQWTLVAELLAEEDPAEWGLAPGAFDRGSTVREVYDLMIRAQEQLLEPDDLRARAAETKRNYLARAGSVLERYREHLRDTSRTDYEGVVRYALDLLRSRPAAGEPRTMLSHDYDHVLVDEFQDTNRSQLELLRYLAPGTPPNLFCVGDDAQSIYGFRGARIENIRAFGTEFPGAKTLQLKNNYRSGTGIVRLAEDVIAGDEERIARDEQRASRMNRSAVVSELAASPRSEGEWIADRIVELNRSESVPFEEIAILRRSLLDAGPLLEALASRGIPVDLQAVQDSSSSSGLLTLLAATEDDPSPGYAARALAAPLVGVSSSGVRRLRTVAEASGSSVFGLLRSGDAPASILEDDLARARAAVAAVDRAVDGKEDFLGSLDALWKGLPGTRELFERHREDDGAARALMGATALLRSARAYASVGQRPTTAGFLRSRRMAHDDSDTWAPPAPPAEGAVHVLTVHGSKGLEFDAVFVSGLTEDRFPVRSRGVRLVDPGLLSKGIPTSRQELERRHLSEERRLLYVAITRARSYLCLTGVDEAAEDGANASPFLKELEDRLVELASDEPGRRFWTSRQAALEELRRLSCDPETAEGLRFAACRALVELGAQPRAGLRAGWWRYLEKTEGVPPEPADKLELRSGGVLSHLKCPRRAFLERFSPGGSLDNRGRFGVAFNKGIAEYLSGRANSLKEAVLYALQSQELGGPAFDEHWRRQAESALSALTGTLSELREDLIEESGEWTIEAGGHSVTGRHGPVARIGQQGEEDSERVLVRLTTSKNLANYADTQRDLSLGLEALGAGAGEARVLYPRKPLASGAPNQRRQTLTKDRAAELRSEVERALAELAAGEIPARPVDEAECGRCAFSEVCPLHEEKGPWST